MKSLLKILFAAIFVTVTASFTPVSQNSVDGLPAYEQPCFEQVDAQASTVYYAPEHGRRYHSTSKCRGLSNANSIASTSEASAQNMGLTPCRLCW